jgi:sulfoquinovosidase
VDASDAAAQPRRRRRSRILLTVLVVVLGIVAAAIWVRLPPPATALMDAPSGSLTSDLGGEWQVGDFTVELDAEVGRLRVTHPAARDVVWETPAGAAFLTAAHGEPSWQDDYGLLRIADDHLATWSEQSVTDVDAGPEGLVLRGRLTSTADPQDGASWELTLTAPDTRRLQIEAEVGTDAGLPPVNRLYLSAALEEDERVFGLGGQTGSYDLRGRRVPILAREQGIGRGEQPLSFLVDLAAGAAGGEDTAYLLSAVHLTDRFRSLVHQGSSIASLDLTGDDRMTWEVWASSTTFSAVASSGPDEVLTAHAGWTGEPAPPPAWTQEGLIAGLQGGTEVVRERVQLLRDAEVPIAAVWLQDWVGQRSVDFGERLQWNWTLDTDRYPGWEDLVDELAAEGIRVLTYASPFLSADSGAAAAAAGRRDLFVEADVQGFLVRGPGGDVVLEDQRGFDAALVDLSDPAARSWLADVLVEELLAVGASGFMADFAEGPPPDAALHGGTGEAWRARWPVLWQEVAGEALRLAGLEDDALVWHRTSHSVSTGRANALWLGDQNQDWSAQDGLGSVPSLLQSAAASGFANTHGDIGGYTSLALPVLDDVARDDELVIRWAEALVLGPVFRTHEGNRPAEVAQPAEDPDLAQALGRITRLFVALGPERSRLAAASPFGAAQHHPWWYTPEATDLIGGADEQLQLGPDLILAPVLEPGAESVEVMLPAGRWVRVHTGHVLEIRDAVETLRVAAPLGSPALFARAGSAVAEELRAAVASGWGEPSP